jgi:hypothetical protein
MTELVGGPERGKHACDDKYRRQPGKPAPGRKRPKDRDSDSAVKGRRNGHVLYRALQAIKRTRGKSLRLDLASKAGCEIIWHRDAIDSILQAVVVRRRWVHGYPSAFFIP